LDISELSRSDVVLRVGRHVKPLLTWLAGIGEHRCGKPSPFFNHTHNEYGL
jgi:hypothetical protein